METMRLSELYKGMEFPEYEYELSIDVIEKYVAAVEESDPLYVNDEYARRGSFGTLIVPPTTISIYVTPSRVFRTIGKAPPPGLIQSGQRYEFHSPVRRGETVVVRASIEDLFERKARQYVVLKGEAIHRSGKKAAASYLTFIWPPEK